ncbi:MAG: hypothetical protein IPM81_11670 [Saprospirales bacterium]|nr:hypothetical protein [Saprospirales bacterium]
MTRSHADNVRGISTFAKHFPPGITGIRVKKGKNEHFSKPVVMRHRLMFYAIVFFTTQIFCQEGFNKKYDLDESLAIFLNCTWAGGDTLALYGLAYSDEVNLHKQGLLFARVDTNGNVIDYHIYNDSVLEYSTYITASIIKLNNNLGFALLAVRSGNDVLIIIDNNEVINKIYEYPNMAYFGWSLKYIIEVNEYFYISGRQYNQSNQGDIFIMKINKEGDIIWVKPYGTSNRDDSVDSFF